MILSPRRRSTSRTARWCSPPDVQPDGSLTPQREFGKLRGGQGRDSSAVDAQIGTAMRKETQRMG
jgi:hypothetical protein